MLLSLHTDDQHTVCEADLDDEETRVISCGIVDHVDCEDHPNKQTLLLGLGTQHAESLNLHLSPGLAAAIHAALGRLLHETDNFDLMAEAIDHIQTIPFDTETH